MTGPETGREMGGYRLVREIGRGAMAVVYEASQPRLRRSVAIKVLHGAFAGEPKAVRRFLREAEAAGRLQHPNVVTVHDRGQADGLPYLVMELVDGPSLGEVLRRARGEDPRTDGRLAAYPGPTAEVAARVALATDVGAQVADALHHAHERGVIHRDVKPSNILLLDGRAKVTDFGLADVVWGSQLTATGERLGTPAYMSPEQAMGKDAEARSDVYSLGATLYEVVTLRPPIEGGSIQDYFQRIPREDPPPARKLEPAIPRDLETVLAKALEKDPARRYPTAAAMAADLRRVAAGDPVEARPAGVLSRAARAARRRPRLIFATTLVLAVLVAAGAVWGFHPTHGPGAGLDVATTDGSRRLVRRVPLDRTGAPQWDRIEEIGWTPLRSTSLPQGEQWIIVGDRNGLAERWIDAEIGKTISLRLRPVAEDEIREDMVRIPAGSAVDGDRTFEWRAFWIDRTEVTVGEYLAFLESTGHVPSDPARWHGDLSDSLRRAAVVSWFDAMAYAEWKGRRLPTTEEWLAAYDAGGRPASGNRDGHRAASVDEHPEDRTGLGVRGMFGNLTEWTLSWRTRKLNPDGRMEPGLFRIVIGGCCDREFNASASSDPPRSCYAPSVSLLHLGVRCARSADR